LTRRRFVFLALALILGAGSITQTVSVQAAPPSATAVTFFADVFLPKAPICAGSDYSVRVTITKLNEVVDAATGQTDWKSTLAFAASGQSVKSSVQDSGIGTLTPAQLMTGWDVDAPDEAVFTFHANKRGSTQLDFTIDIEDYDRKGPLHETMKLGRQIQVVNCKYRVTIVSTLAASFPNLTALVMGVAEGEMTADANGNLAGTAKENWDTYLFSECGSHTTNVVSSPNVTFTGAVSQDGSSLTVVAAYQPFNVQHSFQLSCGAAGGSSDSASVGPTVLHMDLSAAGGSTVQSQTAQWGELNLKGSAAITVVPVESK
jgi:hypothetical protein